MGGGQPRASADSPAEAGHYLYGIALASMIVAAIVGVHAWQQVIWYQKLQPDTQSFATVDCLKRRGIRGGYAEYWTAYKLTFLAQEEIIIAPDGRYRSIPPLHRVRARAPRPRADQCRKWRLPVNTIAMPCSSAAAITSLSRSDPPG